MSNQDPGESEQAERAEATAEQAGDQDAGPASQPTGAAAEQPDDDQDQDSGPATEPV